MLSCTSASPTAQACSGAQYTINSGNTCNSISSSQGISTIDLLAANNLASCVSLPKSGSLCIPSASKCTVYTVQQNDTCASVANAHTLTSVQVVTWNPILSKDCSSIGASVGQDICISAPGGGWTNPSPTSDPPTSTFT